MATIIRTNGTIEELVLDPKSTDGNCEILQKAVGGYIEIIPTDYGNLMVLNEEGKIEGLPPNPMATALVWETVGGRDVIVGDVVVATKEELGE